MSSVPEHELELRAAEERLRLRNSLQELKSGVRETLDIKRATREHLPEIAAVVAVLSLTFAYSFAGIFSRR